MWDSFNLFRSNPKCNMFAVVKTTGLNHMVLVLGYLNPRTGIESSSWSHQSTRTISNIPDAKNLQPALNLFPGEFPEQG